MTGNATGQPADTADLESVRNATDLPVIVGSGATAQSIPDLMNRAHGVIVGSDLKVDGRWDGELDMKRVEAVVASHAV